MKETEEKWRRLKVPPVATRQQPEPMGISSRDYLDSVAKLEIAKTQRNRSDRYYFPARLAATGKALYARQNHNARRERRILPVDEKEDSENKHPHDKRSTFATRLMTTTDLDNDEIAGVMGWSPEEGERIRRIYVDDVAMNVALGRFIRRRL